MGTNWFMPALVKSRLGASGIRLEEGTMVWPLDLKKSRKDCRISLLVINRCGWLALPRGLGQIQSGQDRQRVPENTSLSSEPE